MTMPTKALLPYMLEDYRKVWTDTASKQPQQENSNSPDPLLIYSQE
jgi:hypothetical protein